MVWNRVALYYKGAQIVGVHIANVLFPARRLHEPPPFTELNTGADQFSLEYILTSIPAHVLSDAGQTANLRGKETVLQFVVNSPLW